MSDTIQNWLNKPANAAIAGAAAALVMSMFTPAVVILGVGGAAAAGTYMWKKHSDSKTSAGDAKQDQGEKHETVTQEQTGSEAK